MCQLLLVSLLLVSSWSLCVTTQTLRRRHWALIHRKSFIAFVLVASLFFGSENNGWLQLGSVEKSLGVGT